MDDTIFFKKKKKRLATLSLTICNLDMIGFFWATSLPASASKVVGIPVLNGFSHIMAGTVPLG